MNQALAESDAAFKKLEEFTNQKFGSIQAQIAKLQEQAERNLRRLKEMKQEMEG